MELPPGFFATPLTIGRVTIPNRVVVGPMAGLTNSAYRRHLKSHGAGMVTTEMVSAHGIIYGNVRTLEYLDFSEEERPIAVQLFADDPQTMAAAAEAVLSRPRPPDILDVNMGCPVKKVVRTGAGSALLADPDRAMAVASALVRVADQAGVPVTVKLRSGVHRGERTAPEVARRMEAAGVSGLGVHPRAADQFYQGRADHTVTAEVVAAVGIPVIASGDICSVSAAREVVELTGAPAVMVARGAAGNPWLVDSLLATGPGEAGDEPRGRAPSAAGSQAAPTAHAVLEPSAAPRLAGAPRPADARELQPPLTVVVTDLRLLLAKATADLGPQRAARWSRKLLGWYLKPAGVSARVIEDLRQLPDANVLDAALAALL